MKSLIENIKKIEIPYWLSLIFFFQFIVFFTMIAASILIPEPTQPDTPQMAVRVVETHVFSKFTMAWNRWDTEWFTVIARDGFGETAGALGFAPLYIVATAMVSKVLGGNTVLGALLVSNISVYFLGRALYGFLQEISPDKAVGDRAYLYILAYPSAFLFYGGYTETLYFLLLILSWRNLNKSNFWRAGLWGGLATLTRFPGLFLIVPYTYQLWRKKALSFKTLTAISLIPASFIGWSGFSKLYYGVFPWEALKGQWWFITSSWPWEGILHNLRYLLGLTESFNASFFATGLNAGIGILFLMLFVPMLLSEQKEYALYTFIHTYFAVTATYINGFLSGTSRYLLPVFPAMIELAKFTILRPCWHKVWVGVSVLGLLISTVSFYFWVFVV